jgi:hypothetical protein
MRLGRRSLTGLIIVASCAALAGCGGSSRDAPKTSASAAHPPPKTAQAGTVKRPPRSDADFERAANRLCAEAGGKITALPPISKGEFMSRVVYQEGLIRQLVADLKTLQPPPAKLPGFKRFLGETSAQPRIIDDTVFALRLRNVREARAQARKLSATGNAADHAAASIGLADCARDYRPVPHPTA